MPSDPWTHLVELLAEVNQTRAEAYARNSKPLHELADQFMDLLDDRLRSRIACDEARALASARLAGRVK